MTDQYGLVTHQCGLVINQTGLVTHPIGLAAHFSLKTASTGKISQILSRSVYDAVTKHDMAGAICNPMGRDRVWPGEM